MKTDRDADQLSPEVIIGKLGDSLFSKNIIFRERLDSTNILAKELALKGAPEGTVVLAEEQKAGKGRMNRRWLSQGYKNLLVSILLRPALPVNQVFVMTMILAVAVIDGIRAKNRLNVMVKWPNDLYVDNKKLGGILTEFSQRDGLIEHVILGLGLNVNWAPGEKDGLLYTPTSIFTETGRKVSRNELLAEVLMRFEIYYKDAMSGKVENLYEKWNSLSLVLGKEVDIQSQGENITGTALRIDHYGALVIMRPDGREEKILSGDVSLRF